MYFETGVNCVKISCSGSRQLGKALLIISGCEREGSGVQSLHCQNLEFAIPFPFRPVPICPCQCLSKSCVSFLPNVLVSCYHWDKIRVLTFIGWCWIHKVPEKTPGKLSSCLYIGWQSLRFWQVQTCLTSMSHDWWVTIWVTSMTHHKVMPRSSLTLYSLF